MSCITPYKNKWSNAHTHAHISISWLCQFVSIYLKIFFIYEIIFLALSQKQYYYYKYYSMLFLWLKHIIELHFYFSSYCILYNNTQKINSYHFLTGPKHTHTHNSSCSSQQIKKQHQHQQQDENKNYKYE